VIHVPAVVCTSVTPWINFKRMGSGVNVVRRHWDQREELRAEYEDVHGTDRALWPAQHPGVVLDAVLSSAHGACLGCQWFDVRGHWTGHPDWFERAYIWPHRHQVSNGVFLDGPRRWRGGRFDPHDDDGRPAPSGGSPISEGLSVQDEQVEE
jgi:hypothetical protein